MLVTRPASESDALGLGLRELGAEVVSHPLIEFAAPGDLARIQETSKRLAEFSVLVFLSRRAVLAASDLLIKDVGSLPPIAAIGPGTRDCLQSCGFEVDFVPQEFNSESMADLLIKQHRSTGFSKPILISRGDRGSDVLPTALRHAGIAFEELIIYHSRDVAEADPDILAELSKGKFDWVTISSSSIAANAAKLFGERLSNTKIASISPTTSQTAIECGLSITAEATRYDVGGLVEAILNHHQR